MNADEQDITVWPRNPFGWCAHKWKRGYKIIHFQSFASKCFFIFATLVICLLFMILSGKDMTQWDSIMLISMLLLVGFGMSLPWRYLVDQGKEILISGALKIPFSELMLLISYEKKRNSYKLDAYYQQKRWHNVIWESSEKSEVVGVMDTIFNANILEEDIEGTGLFKYKQNVGSTFTFIVYTLEIEGRKKKVLFRRN